MRKWILILLFIPSILFAQKDIDGKRIYGKIQLQGGSVTAPAYGFNIDTNTGIARLGADSLAFVVGDSIMLVIAKTGIYAYRYGDLSPLGFKLTSGGNVLIGGTGNVAKLTVTGGDGGTNDQGIVAYGTYSDQTAHPIAVVTTHPLASGKAVAAFDADMTITGTDPDHAVGFQSRPSWEGSGMLNDFYGIFVGMQATGDSIKNRYAMRIDNCSGTTLSNKNYGIFISNLTGGTAQNWAIWVDSTNSYFGGDVKFNDSLYTKSAELVVRPTSGTVAMHSTVLDAALNIGYATGYTKGIRISGTYGTDNGYLFQANTNHPLSASGSLVAFDNEVRTTGSNNNNNLIGYQSRQHHNSTGTLSDSYGFYTKFNADSATTLRSFGLYAADPGGSGTLNDNYGLYVEAMTRGGVKNYSIYTAGNSEVKIEGFATVDDSLTIGASGKFIRNIFQVASGDSLGFIYYNTVLSRIDTVYMVQ